MRRIITRRILLRLRTFMLSLATIAFAVAVAFMGRSWLAARAAALTPKMEPAAPITVRVVALETHEVVSALRYSAAVKEFEKAELSFRVGGTVQMLHEVPGPDGRMHSIHEGDVIAKGTPLAQLDDADYRRARDVAVETLATAKSRLAQLESEANLAKVELGRSEILVERNAATASELDAAQARQLSSAAAVAGAQRDVESARIHLEQAAADLEYCTLASPLETGTIAARYIDSGQRVSPSQKAFLVLDLTSVVITFGVPDTIVGRLSLGQNVAVACDALPGEQYTGVIHMIGSAADPQTRTYTVEVRIDEPRGLRPGMIATVTLQRESTVHLLPLSSVVPRSDVGECDVFRVESQDGLFVVRRVSVVFDDVVDNQVAVRLGGNSPLEVGDDIVATGTHRLFDGQSVRVEE